MNDTEKGPAGLPLRDARGVVQRLVAQGAPDAHLGALLIDEPPVRHAVVTILQTADLELYAPLLAITSQVQIAYCRRWNIPYEMWLGLKRGSAPWHATFNRIVMLREMIDRGDRGWVLYLDADTVLNDHDFDLAAYLEDKSRFAAILVPSGITEAWWDVNNGVCLFNLGNEAARRLIARWWRAFMEIDDETLDALEDFGIGCQSLMHDALQAEDGMRDAIRLEPREVWNSEDGTLIRHLLRSDEPDVARRFERLTEIAREILVRANLSSAGLSSPSRSAASG